MNIWILLSRLENGGLERVQINLAGALCDNGHQVTIVAGRVTRHFLGQLPAGVGLLEIAPGGPLFFPLALLKRLLKGRPDCVFTTSNDVACLTLLIRPLLPLRPRVIVTQHLSISGPISRAAFARRLKLVLIRIAMRALFPFADAVIAVSRQVANDLETHLRLRKGSVAVAYNPIVTPDTEHLARQPCNLPWSKDGIPTIAFVGRLVPEKRLDLLLAAFESVRRTRPARLLIVGDGPLRQWVESEMVARGLSTDCLLLGFVQNVLPFIRESDVLVLPSDYEGFGNVLVEAMVCGTQVVSTDCPYGPSEILDDGVYGRLVPPGDADALASAILSVLNGTFRVPPAVLKQRARQFTLEHAISFYLQHLADQPVSTES